MFRSIKYIFLIAFLTQAICLTANADDFSSGTGFFINDTGSIVTNAHVVNGCQSIAVKSRDLGVFSASITTADTKNDIAVLKLEKFDKKSNYPAMNFRARLGENSYVFGFPLTGVLSDTGNFTTGTVTSLQGIGNDSSKIQISTPVQPGNSGGPVLDDKGNLIGIVVGKLDALKNIAATKDIAQNVNFAIRSQILDGVLQAININTNNTPSTQIKQPVDIAELAQSMSVHIICKISEKEKTITSSYNAAKQYDNNHVYIDLAYGRVVIQLFPNIAPANVQRIKELSKRNFYNGVAFHRVIPGFMAQTGDPSGTGMGGSTLPNLSAEFSGIPFRRGIVGMARAQDVNSANSQFFIMLNETPSLNGKYTVIGQVVEGMQFIDKIKKGDTSNNGRVSEPDRIIKMNVF